MNGDRFLTALENDTFKTATYIVSQHDSIITIK